MYIRSSLGPVWHVGSSELSEDSSDNHYIQSRVSQDPPTPVIHLVLFLVICLLSFQLYVFLDKLFRWQSLVWLHLDYFFDFHPIPTILLKLVYTYVARKRVAFSCKWFLWAWHGLLLCFRQRLSFQICHGWGKIGPKWFCVWEIYSFREQHSKAASIEVTLHSGTEKGGNGAIIIYVFTKGCFFSLFQRLF